MPDPTPIYTAIQLVRNSVRAATGAHWQRNDDAAPTMPYLIAQSQDAGGKQQSYVGALDWQGWIVIRAIAHYQNEADAALLPVYAAMQTLQVAAGYRIRAKFDHPIDISPTTDARYAAAQWEVFIERT